MEVREHLLFPTRLHAIEFPGVEALNAELYHLFTQGGLFSGDFAMHPDSQNLLQLADTFPAIAKVRDMFQEALAHWLKAEQALGDYRLDMVLFSNLARKGEFTVAHNHNAEVVGVYYVRTAATDRPTLVLPENDSDYFAAEDGTLLLHDPRFNANLAAVRTIDYARIYPRAGLMLIFPAYVWHSVTPNQTSDNRLSMAANFRLYPAQPTNARSFPLTVA